MAGPLNLYIDTQNRKLVVSDTKNGDAAFPVLVQGEAPTLQMYFLAPTGVLATPFTYVGLSGSTVKMGIIAGSPTGGPDTLIAYQDVWGNVSGGFSAGISLNTIGISNAIAGGSSVSVTVEIEVTQVVGQPVKYLQTGGNIKAAVIDSSSVYPSPSGTYLTLSQSDARYLLKVEGVGVSWRAKSANGLYAVDFGCNNDGTPLIQMVTL